MASRTRSSRTSRGVLCGALAALALAAGLVSAGGASAREGSPFVVCLALDDGAGSALDPLAMAGLNEARRDGVTAYVQRSDMPANDAATVRSCLATGASLTIGVGVLMENALDVVATANPDRRFAIVNAAVESLAHRPHNVTGLVFRAEQAGYLAGYAAGLWAKHHPVNGHHVVASVGSISIPPVDSYLAGFEYGARRADPKVTVINAYTQNTLDPAKCRQRANAEIAKGASVVFAVAGPCSQGVFAATQVAGIYAIGSDSEPTPSPAWMMTTAVKRSDVAVLAVINAASAGTLRGGTDLVFGARLGGVALGTWGPRVPASIRAAVDAQERLLQAGKLQDIPVTL